MKMRYANVLRILVLLAFAGGIAATKGQSTVTFDSHPLWTGTRYLESAMAFQVVLPQGPAYPYYDSLATMPPNWGNNVPQNNTAFMGWFRQNNPYDYVSLSLENGSGFGLTSVQLADPSAPSLSAVSISFIGYLAGGVSVTNTFTTPGNGAATFVTYNFDSNFKSGLTSVDIFAPRWAMDNLVFAVPEPGSLGLTAFGLGILCAWRQRNSRHGSRDIKPKN